MGLLQSRTLQKQVYARHIMSILGVMQSDNLEIIQLDVTFLYRIV